MIPDRYIYDFEVFAHDWCVTFKSKPGGVYYTFWDNPADVISFVETMHPLLGSFNGKHYDRFILEAVLKEHTPQEIKQLNDWIIVQGMNGWDHPIIKDEPLPFSLRTVQYDLKDDCEQGLSLKAIEAHLGMDIRETTVSFDLDRPLTQAEIEEVTFYNRHDVDATDKLDDLRQSYLENKISVGALAGLSPEKSMSLTNAKLSATYLGAVKREYDDEREYKFPDNLRREYVPPELIEFFDAIHDKSIPDEEVFHRKMDLIIGDCPCKLGFGGAHGAILNYQEEETETRCIRNVDVASYYPNLMVVNHYTSRSIPSSEAFRKVLSERLKAKKAGDKEKANALKLVVNSTFGATLSTFNELSDPLMGRSVCISGQLYLIELAEHLVRDCESLSLIQLNTDGIMVSLDLTDEAKYQEIIGEWQQRTGFGLEEDRIKKIVQRDVNNYVEVPVEGKPKIKGGVLVRGVSTAGAFKVNNNAPAVAEAVLKFLADGLPVQETIQAKTDPLDFQIIAKAGSMYDRTYHKVGDIMEEVQRVNRVYATPDWRMGTLYKRKEGTQSLAKMAGLPLRCIVDNTNQIGIESIDKDWYIREAERLCDEFLYGKSHKGKSSRKVNSIAKNIIKKLGGNNG